MKRLPWAIVAVFMLSAAGCARNVYRLEIKPEGPSFQRKLTCWHEPGVYGRPDDDMPVDRNELERIGRLYPKDGRSIKNKRTTFAGTFRGQAPPDIGGAGSYRYETSALGHAAWYIERFRGNDSLETELAARRVATDHVADLIVGWLQAELGSRPNFLQLKRFLNDDFRQDLRNLSLYCWAAEAKGGVEKPGAAEFVVRIGQYLMERGYLGPSDLPQLARALTTSDPGWVWTRVQRLVADKLHVPAGEPIPESLSFLGAHEKAMASLLQYVRGSEIYKQQAARAHDTKRSRGKTEEPKPEDVLGQLVIEGILPPGLLGGADHVELSLAASRPPYETNGRWDAAAAAVQFNASLAQKSALPALFYAFWSEPDDTFQQAHFGRRVLDGDHLAQYVLWYRSLSANETQQWNRFLAECHPGSELVARIEAFRFATERTKPADATQRPVDPAQPRTEKATPPPSQSSSKATSPAKRLSDVVRDLLLPELKGRG